MLGSVIPRVEGREHHPYKATVQAILIFVSETWNPSHPTMKYLEDFQVQVARHILGKLPWEKWDGRWHYPPLKDVSEEVGLFTIDYSIGVRRPTITTFIVNRPSFDPCWDAVRRRRTSAHHYWWEYPMDLDAARASARVAAEDDEEDDTV